MGSSDEDLSSNVEATAATVILIFVLHGSSFFDLLFICYIGCSFKFLLKVGVEESIVNAPQTTDQLLKSNHTFCVDCVFTLQTVEWCVHNRPINANFEDKFK
jgi:hypothetical protein